MTTLGKACVSSTTEEILRTGCTQFNAKPEAGDEFRLAILSECSLELTEWYSSREIIGLDCDSVEPKCKRESQSRSVY
jgi:hypothetical protein